MESRILQSSSSSSSSSPRSSFESRHRSPPGTSSPINYNTRKNSIASSVSNSTDDLNTPLVPVVAVQTIWSQKTVMPSANGHFGDRRQLGIPQKLASRESSSLPNGVYGKSYQARVPGEGFKKLPEEILLGILAELKKSHLASTSLSCATCYMRDILAVGRSCKKWWSAAKSMLYEDIQIVGIDSILQTKKKFKTKYGTRLKLLRRTLQARKDLAEHVKSLKVPATPEVAKTQKEKEQYMDLVASVIMACPNLERVPGFYPTYNHEFSRFVHAMSTRTKLQEHVWVMSGNPHQKRYQHSLSTDSESLKPVLVPSFVPPEQCIEFLSFHQNWSCLHTLVMHCNPDGAMNSPLFIDIFKCLPALENLHLSSFPATSFNDSTLLSLPALKKLRLENLPGVTDEGLSNYASPKRTDKLTSLSLISLSIQWLPVIARLFSHLKSLTHFKISQARPLIGLDIFLYPYLASSTITYLHWEFTNTDDDKSTDILVKSIACSGFPCLKTIRAPTDLDGSLQNLCRPKDRLELSGDKYRNFDSRIDSTQGMPSLASPTRKSFSASHSHSSSLSSAFMKSPSRSAFSLNTDCLSNPDESNSHEKGMSLATARRLAQGRIEMARAKPMFHIILWDEDREFLERHEVGGFLGKIESKIDYVLKPDLDGSDDSLMRVETLIDTTDEMNIRDGCTGSWNSDPTKGKKGKEKWYHTERGRCKDLPIGSLF